MQRVQKIESIQSGPFTDKKNLIDFHIPGGRQYDMSRSYVNLRANITTTDAAGTGTGAGVYNWTFNWSNDGGATAVQDTFKNNALVKNVRLTSATSGVLEDIRRNDVLRQQLYAYTDNEEDCVGVSYKEINQRNLQGNIKVAPGVEFFSEGSTKSVQNIVDVVIPMSHLVELGRSSALPCDKLGQLRLHLECNLDKWIVSQLQGAGSGTGAAGLDMEFGTEANCRFDTSAVAVGDLTEITCSQPFINPDCSPYWVGQKIEVQGVEQSSGSAILPKKTTITAIAYDDATQKITLTTADTITTLGAGESLGQIKIDGVDAGSLSLEWTQAQVVVVENSAMQSVDELVYNTYTNEEDSGAGQTSFSRMYNVEAEAFNVLLCLPDTTSDLTCSNNAAGTQYQDYRLRNNNVALTDRRVEISPRTPLYYDRVAMYLLNGAMPLRNLHEKNMASNQFYDDRYTAADAKDLVFLGNPLPITPQRKLLQVDINGATGQGGVNKLLLYKSVARRVAL